MGLGYSALTGRPMWEGILYTSVILVMVVLLGGMRLTAWVNILLGTLFTTAFLGSLLWVTFKFFPGGFSDAVDVLRTHRPDLLSTPGPEGRFTPDFTTGVFAVGLLAVTWPHVVVGTMTAQEGGVPTANLHIRFFPSSGGLHGCYETNVLSRCCGPGP